MVLKNFRKGMVQFMEQNSKFQPVTKSGHNVAILWHENVFFPKESVFERPSFNKNPGLFVKTLQ